MKTAPAHILVGSDLSARSDRALQRAFLLARTHGAKVTVATVIDDAMPEDMTNDARTKAEAVLTRSADYFGDGVPHEIIARIGHPATDMRTLTQEVSPDLLVLGTHRDKSFLGALRETTAQRIVRLTDCPVLVVCETADHDYDHVVAATDFSPAATAAMTAARVLAPGADITPVHAIQIPYSGMLGTTPEAKHALEASFRNDAQVDDAKWRESLGTDVADTRFMAGSAHASLRLAIDEIGATLLTVGAHGRVGASRTLLGSLATDLMREPITDLLVARP